MLFLPATLLKVTRIHWCFFTVFKLYKWYQVAQSVSFTCHVLMISNRVYSCKIFPCFFLDIGENFNFLKYYNFFSLPPTTLYQIISLILKRLSKLKKVWKVKIRQQMKQLHPRQLLLVLQLPKVLQKRWWRKAVEQIPHHFFVDMLLKESVFLKENW